MKLKEVLLSHDAVIFVGSGLSKAEPPDYRCGYPSWPDLIKALCIACMGCIPHDDNWNGWGDPEKLIELAEDARQASRSKYDEVIRRIFCDTPKVATPEVYRYLARLNAKSYVTTNYDSLLRNALEDIGVQRDVHVYPKLQHASRVSAGGLFHIHGYVGTIDDNMYSEIVLSKEEFDMAYCENRPLVRLWDTMLDENCVVFIGTSLSDPSTRSMLDKYKERSSALSLNGSYRRRDSFVLIGMDEQTVEVALSWRQADIDRLNARKTQEYCTQIGLVPVLYDKEDPNHSGLLHLLKEIAPRPSLKSFNPIFGNQGDGLQ
ncbi:MAG: SIR2 family protein [Candidatus Marinimicrobia bacterium]|nr:SIR2 family protein [Candidatus Neomarinimicrobiota bacterium]